MRCFAAMVLFMLSGFAAVASAAPDLIPLWDALALATRDLARPAAHG